MLILRSIYREIGPGERVALSKLAIEKFEHSGRPLRIAIDISIWQFQMQAGQGGSNPAIRTFYYRLLRLLSTSVQPLFVFDGPHKPPFKRNKRTGQHGATIPNLLTKQVLKLFGFPFYIAPGEAEAECALLQREGLVDAVLSEDVDTLMFGCGMTFRNWSSEGARGNKSPTHVSVYDSKATKSGKSRLDREGMALVALMSGGDYITEGIPGCGIKLACEAARAGYGKSLCQLSRSDLVGLEAWRKNLAYEIKTNESKHFRTKRRTLEIPDDFPNREALGYYTHPVVSTAARIQNLKERILWDAEVDIPGLRKFVAEAFDWTHKIGAKKFIRGLAPAILVHKLRLRGDRRDSGYGDVLLTAMNEMELVREICGKRNHFSTDGIPELRVIYHPAQLVGIDLDTEEDGSGDYGRDGLAPLNEDDQIESYLSDEATERSRSASPTKRNHSVYDPTQPEKVWIPETILKVGIPLKVQDYEESLRDPHKFIKAKYAAKKAATRSGMQRGAMEKFVKITKPVTRETILGFPKAPETTSTSVRQPAVSPVCFPPSLGLSSQGPQTTTSMPSSDILTRPSSPTNVECTRSKPITTKPKLPGKVAGPKATPHVRTAASRPAASNGTPRITRYLNYQPCSSSPPAALKQTKLYDLTSNTPSSSTSAPLLQSDPSSRKHMHSPPIEISDEAEVSSILPSQMQATDVSQNTSDSPKPSGVPSQPSPHKEHSPSLIRTRHGPGRRRQPHVISLSSSPPVAIKRPDDTEPEERTKERRGESVGKKWLMLRDSLPGAWKEVDEVEVAGRKGTRACTRRRAWRLSQVEMVDLSAETASLCAR